MAKKRAEEEGGPVQWLRRDDVGALLGLEGRSISTYLTESRPGAGGRYEAHPFPGPDHYIGRIPLWRADQTADILKWNENRLGAGAGGGRKVRERITCPTCGRDVTVDESGHLAPHHTGAQCEASGTVPKKPRKASR